MFHRAAGRADTRPDVLRPFPTRLVSRATNGQAAKADDLESALGHDPRFVRRLKTLEDDIDFQVVLLLRCYPLRGRAEYRLDIDNGRTVDDFDWTDQHPVLLDAPHGHLVQAERVWPVR